MSYRGGWILWMLAGALSLAGCAVGTTEFPDGGSSPRDGGGDSQMLRRDGGGCTGATITCAGQCVNITTDSNNCGACGTRCNAGQTCSNGSCTGGGTCASPRIMCGGACIDPRSDPNNCGACGNVCTGGSCAASVCTGGGTCPSPNTMCGTLCTNTDTDARNCGFCGNACGAGQTCASGTCTTTSTCTAPRRLCSGVCTDVTSDASNCGACARACAAGQVCSGSVCTGGSSSGTVGSACTAPTDCGSDPNAGCFTPSTVWQNGYCSIDCSSTGTCPSGSTCVTLGSGADCMQSCAAPGTGRSTCRAGYACVGLSDGSGVCFPACTNSARDICGSNRCNTTTLDCDPCTTGADCNGGSSANTCDTSGGFGICVCRSNSACSPLSCDTDIFSSTYGACI